MAAASAGTTYGDYLKMSPAELQVYGDGSQVYMNRLAWMIGIYVQDAVAACLSAAFAKKGSRDVYKYPARPHESLQPMSQEEKRNIDDGMTKEEREVLLAKIYMSQMLQAGKHWGRGG